jgi:hypothetical protein
MTVISFRKRHLERLSARPCAGPVAPPPALGAQRPASKAGPDAEDAEDAEDADFYRMRTRQNWAALALLIVLVVGGAWLIERLAAFSRALACYEFGHRNCAPLKVDPAPRQR